MAWGPCLPAWAWTESGRPGFGFSCIPHRTKSKRGSGAGGKGRAEAQPLRVGHFPGEALWPQELKGPGQE